MINNPSQRLRVGTLLYFLIGVPGTLFFFVFLGIDVMQWKTMHTVGHSIIPYAVPIGGLVLCLLGGKIELTSESIRTFTLLGAYELKWEEISGFTFEPYFDSLFLFADGKQLYVPTPKIWSGRDKNQAKMFMIEHFKQHPVPIMKEKRFLIFSRNCRMHKSTNN